MGNWSNRYLNIVDLPQKCIVYAGTTRDELKKDILSNYTNVELKQNNLFEGYIAERSDTQYVLLFQIYGAAMMADIVHILADGQVKEVVLIGAVHSFDISIDIGSIIVPEKIQTLDGIVNGVENTEITFPDEEILSKLKTYLKANEIRFRTGKTVSVPSVFVKPSTALYHADTIALEMETGSLFYYAKKNNIKAAAIHVVSDNMNYHLYESQQKRYDTISKLSKIAI